MLQGEHSAILSTFIKLPFVIKIFVLSILEWPFYTGFTVTLSLAFYECFCLNIFLKVFVKGIYKNPEWFRGIVSMVKIF